MSPREAEEILELAPPYTREDMETAYHAALNLWHPTHFSEDEALLAEAMDHTVLIGEAYQVLTAPPAAKPKPLKPAFAAPQLAEPKVETVMPRILGPRLRLPQPLDAPSFSAPSRSPGASPARKQGPALPLSRPPSLAGTAPISRPKPKPPPAMRRPSGALWGSAWFWGTGLVGVTFAMGLSIALNGRPGGSSSSSSSSFSSGSAGRSDTYEAKNSRESAMSSHTKEIPPLMAEAYQRASQGNDAAAQRELGHAFKAGSEVPRDASESVFWYRKAAEQNDPVAQRELGHAYREGKGVPQSVNAAIPWYKKAAANGDEEAQRSLNELR
ncbi:MAG: hypothetical protein ACAI34_18425 [Verrucomicrobium sp.]